MRYFHWKTVIVSILVFILPVFLYPVSGTMSNGVTTYSYGFPSPWLSLQFENRGGSLCGFEIFGSNIAGSNVSILTALLDLLIIYLVLAALVKVFWTNHFAIKFASWKEKRYYKKHGIVQISSESGNEQLKNVDCTITDDDFDGISLPVIVDVSGGHEGNEKAEPVEEVETNKTA